MSDELKDLLTRRSPSEPFEFALIRQFVKEKLGFTPQLGLYNDSIVIIAPNAAAASSLRFELPGLTRACKTNRRLTVRIGSD